MDSRLILQIKDVFGHWEDRMTYATLEQVRAAWPYFRKDTKRDMRCIRRTEEVVENGLERPPNHE